MKSPTPTLSLRAALLADAPPTVAFIRPAPGAPLSGRPTLSANAADDRGIASVRFLAGEREICTDTAAPYDCAFRLTSDDVGRTTLAAVATDTAGQTGAALRNVRVARFTQAAVSARVSPAQDRTAPHRLRARGSVRLPDGVARATGCGTGFVNVQIKAGRETISNRRTTLTRSCTFGSSVSFRRSDRFARSGRLTVRVRFLGNTVLGARRARLLTVRTR